MLGMKMAREGFSVAGGDIDIETANHVWAACSEEFAVAFGPYFGNDTGRFPRHMSLRWICKTLRKSSEFSRRR